MISRPASAGLAASCQATHICHGDHCDFFCLGGMDLREHQRQPKPRQEIKEKSTLSCFFFMKISSLMTWM